MELEGFGTLSDPKGNIKIASKGLTGLGYRIAGLVGMNVKYDISQA